MADLNWESVKHNWIWKASRDSEGFPAFNVVRAQVPGGWLVTIQQVFEPDPDKPYGDHRPGGLTFVPDEDYSWE